MREIISGRDIHKPGDEIRFGDGTIGRVWGIKSRGSDHVRYYVAEVKVSETASRWAKMKAWLQNKVAPSNVSEVQP